MEISEQNIINISAISRWETGTTPNEWHKFFVSVFKMFENFCVYIITLLYSHLLVFHIYMYDSMCSVFVGRYACMQTVTCIMHMVNKLESSASPPNKNPGFILGLICIFSTDKR